MNLRQQKYKKNRMLGMYPANAGRAAGFSESYVRQSTRIEARINMRDVFERKGLTDKQIADIGLAGLSATKIIVINGKTRNVPDWITRHKFFETILKLTDRLKDKPDVVIPETKIIIIRNERKTEDLARPIHVQPEEVSGDVRRLGDGQEHVVDTPGYVIQRANPQ